MRFSVIMPAYNAGNTISTSVDSVLNQTFSDFELLIINDGSTDNTISILEKYNDSRIRIINKENGGVSSTRNIGIKKSVGEYICFLDSDDIWDIMHLECMNTIIEKLPDINVLFSSYSQINLDDSIKNVTTDKLKFNFDDYILLNDFFEMLVSVGQFFHINALCIKRKILSEDFLFIENEKIGEDTDFIYRLAAFNDVVITKYSTAYYIRNHNSVTSKRCFNFNWCFAKNIEEILNSELVSNKKKKNIMKVVSNYDVSCVRNYILINKKKKAIGYLFKIRWKYLNVKRFLQTMVLLFIPCRILINYVEKRDKNIFRGNE